MGGVIGGVEGARAGAVAAGSGTVGGARAGVEEVRKRHRGPGIRGSAWRAALARPQGRFRALGDRRRRRRLQDPCSKRDGAGAGVGRGSLL